MAAEEHAHKVWTEYKVQHPFHCRLSYSIELRIFFAQEHVAQTDSAIRELQQQLTIAEEVKIAAYTVDSLPQIVSLVITLVTILPLTGERCRIASSGALHC